MECRFCRYRKGHAAACPDIQSDPGAAEKVWRTGWTTGRRGGVPVVDADATYRLGWLAGEVALEEAANSEPW